MINREKFFNRIRPLFKGKLDAKQVQGITAVLDEWDRRKLKDARHLGYMLATDKWETAHTMQPIQELGGLRYLRSKRYWPWIGRGLVQLTWEFNYKKAGDKIGVDLISDPDKALDVEIAVKIMFDGMIEGWFTGKKLSDYFNASKNDPINARRIINGIDKAREIAAIAQAFTVALIEAKENEDAV